MKLLLRRMRGGPRCTLGKLYVDGVFECYTLEDPVRELLGSPVAKWKQHGCTAIPSTQYCCGATYKVTLETSARFGPSTLTIRDVPGYSGVRMHAGNTEADTEGCVLLGNAIDSRGIVNGSSRPAVAAVKKIVKDALTHGEIVELEIDNASLAVNREMP